MTGSVLDILRQTVRTHLFPKGLTLSHAQTHNAMTMMVLLLAPRISITGNFRFPATGNDPVLLATSS